MVLPMAGLVGIVDGSFVGCKVDEKAVRWPIGSDLSTEKQSDALGAGGSASLGSSDGLAIGLYVRERLTVRFAHDANRAASVHTLLCGVCVRGDCNDVIY